MRLRKEKRATDAGVKHAVMTRKKAKEGGRYKSTRKTFDSVDSLRLTCFAGVNLGVENAALLSLGL